MDYQFKRTNAFRKSFDALNDSQKETAKKAFKVFKNNPFDPRLKTHKINRLSALYGKTVYSVTILGDLRSVFFIEDSDVISLDIGTHAIYK